jgi:hypothetical protein
MDRQRSLRNQKQRRYRERLRKGYQSFRISQKPAIVAALLKAAGVEIPNLEVQTLNAGLEVFIDLWQKNRVRVTRNRDNLG